MRRCYFYFYFYFNAQLAELLRRHWVQSSSLSKPTSLPCPCRSEYLILLMIGIRHAQHNADLPWIVHATHLAKLVPRNVSTSRACVSIIRGFLERACLPDEVIAFAACILDALSDRFASTWRDALQSSNYVRNLKMFLKTDTRLNTSISPDVIVLASLALAHGFLVDRLRSSKHWSVRESSAQFTVQEIEATKRAILQDMDYGLFRISDDMVQQVLKDVQRSCSAAVLGTEKKAERPRNLSLSFTGTAKWNYGVQTPEPSP